MQKLIQKTQYEQQLYEREEPEIEYSKAEDNNENKETKHQ